MHNETMKTVTKKRMTAKDALAYLEAKGGVVSAEFVSQQEARLEALAIQLRILEGIKAARLENNLTQQKLSDLSGVPQPEISRFEAGDGNPTLETLAKLCHALGCSLSLTHV